MGVEGIGVGLLLVAGCLLGLGLYEALVRVALLGLRSSDGRAVEVGGRVSRGGDKAGEDARPAAGRPQGVRGRIASVLGAMSGVLDRFAPFSRADVDNLRERLARSGVEVAPGVWRSVRFAVAVFGLLAGCAVSGAFEWLPLAAKGAVVCAGALAGWMAPSAVLSCKEKERRRAIEARLPDAMELLGIALAAGSPVEQCFREVAASLSGPLAQELARVDQEVNLLGHARETALENLANRCKSQEVSAFVAQLTQAIAQGASIAEGLAVQAQVARETAQADMLERIRKMPTKLDIVLSLCFLPPTVLVVIVPTIVSLLEFLNDSMA